MAFVWVGNLGIDSNIHKFDFQKTN